MWFRPGMHILHSKADRASRFPQSLPVTRMAAILRSLCWLFQRYRAPSPQGARPDIIQTFCSTAPFLHFFFPWVCLLFVFLLSPTPHGDFPGLVLWDQWTSPKSSFPINPPLYMLIWFEMTYFTGEEIIYQLLYHCNQVQLPLLLVLYSCSLKSGLEYPGHIHFGYKYLFCLGFHFFLQIWKIFWWKGPWFS